MLLIITTCVFASHAPRALSWQNNFACSNLSGPNSYLQNKTQKNHFSNLMFCVPVLNHKNADPLQSKLTFLHLINIQEEKPTCICECLFMPARILKQHN